MKARLPHLLLRAGCLNHSIPLQSKQSDWMKKAGRDGRTAADWWHSHKANPFSRTNPFETSEQFSVPFSARVHQVLA